MFINEQSDMADFYNITSQRVTESHSHGDDAERYLVAQPSMGFTSVQCGES